MARSKMDRDSMNNTSKLNVNNMNAFGDLNSFIAPTFGANSSKTL
jgi:hypothetical protein